jgi:osmoprotectant transport system permease protein
VKPRAWPVLLLLGFAAAAGAAATGNEPVTVRVGSKSFTESVILGEMIRHLAASTGQRSYHQRELGGTRVLWEALLAGEIDIYPEYTGTLMQEILVREGIRTEAALEAALQKRGVRMTRPLGFNNTYAIGVKAALADELGLRDISDLRRHPELALGFGNEFMNRADGWPGLKRRYRLPHANVRGLDHDLAYRSIATGTLHVTDLYATDAEIAYYELRALRDDLRYFPVYHAVILYRAGLEQRAPEVVAQLRRIEGRIDEAAMVALNARVKLEGDPESAVAADFLEDALGLETERVTRTAWQRFRRHTQEHLVLVAISLGSAILVAVPLGIAAARRPRLGQLILGVTGIVQTIPSLALFVFMIPLLGIGGPPAVVALFLYSLLPIVRNTHAGLHGIPRDIRESAEALGLPRGARLRLIELPLAARSILAGIKTSAVINVGTATLAALIGAGGYGQPILTGIRLDDTALILQGAVPAALLALLVQGLFELLERGLLPRGLRLGAETVR